MFIHVVTMATLYYMLSTLFYVNFSFYGLNSNKGYKSVRKPSHLPISLPTKWSRRATLQISLTAQQMLKYFYRRSLPPVPSALLPVPSALLPVPSALLSVPSALLSVPSALLSVLI